MTRTSRARARAKVPRVAALIHLDTHVVAWLYEPRTDLLSRRATALVEGGSLQISPAVMLELAFRSHHRTPPKGLD